MFHWQTAFRQLLRRPAFTIAILLLLALGIGINTTVFSIVETVLLKPLPYPSSNRLVFVLESESAKKQPESLIAPVRLEDWNRLNRTFTALAGQYSDSVTDTSTAAPERLAALRVTPRYFTVYGSRPVLGRTFNAQEEAYGGPTAVVISHHLWTRRFNQSPNAIGKRLVLGGQGYTVVGVMPKTFVSPVVDVWLVAALSPGLAQARDARFMSGVGRLQPNVTMEQAQQDLARVQRELGEQFPRTDKNWSAMVVNLKQHSIGDRGQSVWLTFGATGMLLLLACANIASLLLGRIYQREREFAIRASLGASRFQIIAAVMREVALIALAGSVLGTFVSFWGVALAAKAFGALPRINELQLNWQSVLFAFGLGVLVLFLIGLLSAFQNTPTRLADALAQGSRTQVGTRHSFQRVLLVAQFAITVILLSCAGLLLRSYRQLTSVQTGFNTENVLTFHVGAEWSEDRPAVGRMQQQILAELGRLPNVQAAGFTNFLPTDEATLRYQYELEGLPGTQQSATYTAGSRTITPGYLAALQIPLLAGKTCPEPDLDWNKPAKALVNRAFVQEFSHGQNLIGRHLRIVGTDAHWNTEIAGIVGDAREDSFRLPAAPYVYACDVAGSWPDPEYVVRTCTDARQFAGTLRAVVHKIAPTRALFGVQTMEEHVEAALDQPRLTTRMLMAFAMAALGLAGFGLYSLTMLTVTAKTREIGTRMALGAQTVQVISEVLFGAAKLMVAGLVIGMAGAVIAGIAIRSVLFGVSPVDPLTLGAVSLVLLLICFVATIFPAWRAASIDPIQALRIE